MKKPKWKIHFYKAYIFQWKPSLRGHWYLLWKDKYNTPRHEHSPQWRFTWLWFEILLIRGTDDDEWEQYLWTHEYCDGDVKKAEETWQWRDYTTKLSTWKNYK